MADPILSRTRDRVMVSGVFWNALGRGLPLLLALLLTPVLVHQLGLERWGLFTLALAMVGVFGIFDFGVGQALTRALSEKIGQGREGEAAGVLAAYQRFRAANLVTIPVAIFYYLGPVLVLLVWDSLVAVMLTLVAVRFA